jgi:hypothetical protein
LLLDLLGHFSSPLVAGFVESIINDMLKLSLAVSRFCFLDSHGMRPPVRVLLAVCGVLTWTLGRRGAL